MREYHQTMAELRTEIESPPGKYYRVFNYSNSSYYDDYDTFYRFVMQSKNDLFKGLINEPFYFYFIDTNDVDAYACRQNNGFNVIGVSKGLFEKLALHCDVAYQRLKNIDTVNVPELENLMGCTAVTFMFMTACHFIHNHELAHIIQFEGKRKQNIFETKYINENINDPIGNFCPFIQHLKERDADVFGANAATRQILQHWVGLPDTYKNIQSLESLVSMGIVSTYILFDLLSNGIRRKVYFFETDHPHTIMRLHQVMLIFEMKAASETKLLLSSERILRSAFHILYRIGLDNPADKFLTTLINKPLDVDLYLFTLFTESKYYTWLAGNQMSSRSRFRSRKT